MYPIRKDKKFYLAICIFIIANFSSIAFSLGSDNKKPMQIIADSSLINYKTGVYTYEGNVKITQGTTQLTADRVITKNNDKHQIKEAIAYGIKQLAEYTTIPREGDKTLHAQAKIIRFYPPTATVVLEDNAIVTQGENSFHGSLIFYNIKDQIVTAPASKNGRAVIMVEPQTLR